MREPSKAIQLYNLGTDGDDESEESENEYTSKLTNKKSTDQKSSSNGEELKQSLTKLLNTGHSLPDEQSSKSISVSHDEAWVEVCNYNLLPFPSQLIYIFLMIAH